MVLKCAIYFRDVRVGSGCGNATKRFAVVVVAEESFRRSCRDAYDFLEGEIRPNSR
jgi:hypothetical protein